MVNKIIPIVLLAIYIQCINSQKDYGQDKESKCREDQECVPLVSCNPVFELILDVKDDPVNSDWRRHVIDVIRERVCGPRMLRKVCCPKIPLVEVGKLKPYYYNVNGAVHVFDSQSLLIKNFSYTGQGPDAILYAGVSGRSHEVIF